MYPVNIGYPCTLSGTQTIYILDWKMKGKNPLHLLPRSKAGIHLPSYLSRPKIYCSLYNHNSMIQFVNFEKKCIN